MDIELKIHTISLDNQECYGYDEQHPSVVSVKSNSEVIEKLKNDFGHELIFNQEFNRLSFKDEKGRLITFLNCQKVHSSDLNGVTYKATDYRL